MYKLHDQQAYQWLGEQEQSPQAIATNFKNTVRFALFTSFSTSLSSTFHTLCMRCMHTGIADFSAHN